MQIPVLNMKPGMRVHVSMYGSYRKNTIEYRNLRVHYAIPYVAVICECGDIGIGRLGREHGRAEFCASKGFPMDPDKRYVSFCAIDRAYYSAVLDKKAISVMLVKMQGDYYEDTN